MKNWLLVSSLVLALSPAQAQNYVGLELGAALPDIDGIVSANRDEFQDGGAPVDTSKDSVVSALRIFGGMALSPRLDIELGYLSTGNISISYSRNPERWTQDFNATGFDLAAVYKPFDTGFFVKGGVHATKSKVKNNEYQNDALVFADTGTESGTGFLLGVGYQAPVAKGLNLRGSFVRYQRISGESDFNLNMVTLGLTKSF